MEKIEADSRLILEVESHPMLYNKSLPEYKFAEKKEMAWQQVAVVLNKTVVDCKKRWKGLRDTFATNFKAEKNVASGSGATPSCKWLHYKSMMFLLPFTSVPTTQGNYCTNNPLPLITEDLSFDELEGEDTQFNNAPTPVKTQKDVQVDRKKSAAQSCSATNPRIRRRDNSDDVSSILNAIATANEMPQQTANQLFYAAIATRAERLSRKEQSQLQIQVLQLMDQYEFGVDEETLA